MAIKKSETIYDTNKTMQLLGSQFTGKAFWGDVKVKSDIKDILSARGCKIDNEIICDIFMLGYMKGKRAARTEKNKSAKLILG